MATPRARLVDSVLRREEALRWPFGPWFVASQRPSQPWTSADLPNYVREREPMRVYAVPARDDGSGPSGPLRADASGIASTSTDVPASRRDYIVRAVRGRFRDRRLHALHPRAHSQFERCSEMRKGASWLARALVLRAR